MADNCCLECQETFKGRADKKFCSDYCRTSYHNKQNAISNSYVRIINNILRKNRRILLKHNPQDKAKTSKSLLIREGFNFNYFTNEYVSKAGKVYRFCYDQGYLVLDNDLIVIVKKKDYVT